MNRPQVRADVFPAIVVLGPPTDPPVTTSLRAPDPATAPGTKMLEKVRVIVTLDSVYIFKDSPTGPTLVFKDKLEDYVPPNKQPPPTGSIAARAAHLPQATLTTDSGKTLAFHKSSGCGCGSRLRSFNPFPHINQAASTNDR